MNGSSSSIDTPANARRTGKPSPSNPRGAVVTELTGRTTVRLGSRAVMRGSASVLAVTAGISKGVTIGRDGLFLRAVAQLGRDGAGGLEQGRQKIALHRTRGHLSADRDDAHRRDHAPIPRAHRR